MILFFLFTIGIEFCIFRDQARVFPLSTLAPTLAYLLFILFFRKMAVPIVLDVNKTVLFKLVQAIIVPLLLMVAAFIAGNILGMNIVPDSAGKIIESVISLMFIVIVGGVGEEIGWRSFLQTTLEKRCPVLASSIIVGIMWGLWHIDRWSSGIIFMSIMVLQTVSFSIIITSVLKDTKNNIIISTMIHGSFNVGFLIFFGTRFTEIEIMLLVTLTLLITAIVAVILNRNYFLRKSPAA